MILHSAVPVFGQLTGDDIQVLQERGEQEGWTFQVGENSATRRPLYQLCGSYLPPDWQPPAIRKPLEPLAVDLPRRFDWRDYRALPPVRDQDTCGSCWAFATTGVLECAITLTDDVIENLSEQWLVTCNVDGWSCAYGGFAAHDYYQGTKTDPCGNAGAVYEADCPYTASDEACGCPYTHHYLIQDWDYATNNVLYLKRAILEFGPVYVSIYAESEMQSYSGGIFNACVNDQGTNHAVVLVGWDDDQGTAGVWFVRNSWGAGWGEDDGYMRIEYNCSNVGQSPSYINYNGEFGPPLLVPGACVFQDDEGNDDGRADPGENNVQLLVTVSNCGTEMLGLTMTASTTDPEIVFTESESSYGDLSRWDQNTNGADPITFNVDPDFPPTIVKFVLSFSANGGAYTYVETLTVDVGQPQVLLVDDDAAIHLEYEEYFTHLLDSLRTPHVIWGKDTLSSPPPDTLGDYPLALWFTGNARSEVLSVDDVNNLRAFLSNGGRLLMTGQDIAEDLANDADSTFLRDYLHIRFVSGIPMILASGVTGDPISSGHILPLGGPGGAANQTSPDKLEALDATAKVCYTYYGGGNAGVHVAAGGYKAVFLGFGIEAIANGLPGYTKREVVLASIFDWLLEEETCDCGGPGDVNHDGGAPTPLDVTFLVQRVYKGQDALYDYHGLSGCPFENGDVDGSGGAPTPLDVTFLVTKVYKSQDALCVDRCNGTPGNCPGP
jgi:hypothetical protein